MKNFVLLSLLVSSWGAFSNTLYCNLKYQENITSEEIVTGDSTLLDRYEMISKNPYGKLELSSPEGKFLFTVKAVKRSSEQETRINLETKNSGEVTKVNGQRSLSVGLVDSETEERATIFCWTSI